jgi:DNA-binding NarL/FixJ family response regulator
VLTLLAEGLPNAGIARRLFISPKTVDHHISSMLTKLNARSRNRSGLNRPPVAPPLVARQRLTDYLII